MQQQDAINFIHHKDETKLDYLSLSWTKGQRVLYKMTIITKIILHTIYITVKFE